MANKRIETNRAPDGRFTFSIGEVDSMGGFFAIFFEDFCSGSWKHLDKNGKKCHSAKAVETVYEGKFFDTAAQALTAGRKARDAA